MGENIDDLRVFLEQQKAMEELNATEEVNFEKKNFFMEDPDIEKFMSATSVTKDLKKLTERVDELEVLNYGLWLMLEKKGFTHDEFNAALKEAKEKVLSKLTTKTETISCPKCGKALQAADVFGVRCIYCGYEQDSNPYQQNIAKVEEAEPVAEAYDVTKDLNFDEE